MLEFLGRLNDETPPRRAAEMYRAAGLDPIPIHGLVNGSCTCGREDCDKSAGKHPVGASWQNREIEFDEFTDERNVGLRMGGQQNLIAIDVDGPHGIEELALLIKEHGMLPNTLTSESGSGGLHYLFTTDAIDQIRNSAKKLAEHVDLRVRGGQIVVAPSHHRLGGRYRWKELHDVAQLPPEWEAAILKLYEEPERPPAPASPAIRTEDYQTQLRRASAYLATIPSAISGSGGHKQTFVAAAKMVHGFGLSDADALDLIVREYNPRCEPPWKRGELDHKVTSAREKASGALRERVPDRERAYVPPERTEDWIPEPPEWLVEAEVRQEAEQQNSDMPDPEDVERAAIQGEPERKRPAFTILSMQDLLQPVMEQMATAGPHNAVGVPTGSSELDEAIGRLRPGNITVLGARRSFGKTSCTIMTVDEAFDAANVWGKRHHLLLFAGEDAALMYGKRFMARRANVNALQLRDMNQRFTAVQLQNATNAVANAPRELFFVPAQGMPVEHIAEVIGHVCETEAIELVIVDYIQCLQTRKYANDRRLQVTHIFQTLGHTIKRCNAAGLILSQVKRTQNLTQWPTVEDLKESGDVEDGAEHILIGHKTDAGRFIRVAKNKDGTDPDDLPDIEMPFHKHTASFVRNYPPPPSAPYYEIDDPDSL